MGELSIRVQEKRRTKGGMKREKKGNPKIDVFPENEFHHEYRKGDISKLLDSKKGNEGNEDSTSILTSLFGSRNSVEEKTLKEGVSLNDSKKRKFSEIDVSIEADHPDELKRRLEEGLRKAREVERRYLKIKEPLRKKSRIETRVVSKEEGNSKDEENSKDKEFSRLNKVCRGRRELTEEGKKEENRRTIFTGNIPLDMNESQLMRLLDLQPSQIQSIRFRSIPVDPKFSNNRLYAAASKQFTGTCTHKNAYLVLKNENEVKAIIAKNGLITPADTRLRITSVAFKRDEFSTFPRRSTVFVGNLFTKTTEEDLWNEFQNKVGEVKNVRIVRDNKIYVSKGFGFVQLADRVHVAKAIKVMNGYVINGRPLNVTKALDQKDAKQDDLVRKQLVARKIQSRRTNKIEGKLVKHKKFRRLKK